MYRWFKILTITAFAIFFIVKLYYCKGIKAPAPHGIHGEYALTSNPPIYTTNGITKDAIIKVLVKENLVVKSGRLNDYDASWDSLRYLIGNIPCGEQKIEAYIEFKDKKAVNTTFQILWFNAEPTKDNNEYQKRTENYYKCFEALLNKNKLVK